MGMLDFIRRPHYKHTWNGAFNGQESRKAMFIDLQSQIKFDAIVETGTFKGTSTRFLHKSSGLPVHTVEYDARHYGFAKARFLTNSKVSTNLSDSRLFLKNLINSNQLNHKKLFFYLDAHWGDDIPLIEELVLIFNHWENAVVMIDDFQIIDDNGYTFDDYGNGNALTLDYISTPELKDLNVFYPLATSEIETGEKRGCVILAKSPEMIQKLSNINSVRRWEEGMPTSKDQSQMPGRKVNL
jgi:hypothetical protein